jgi:DNA-binding NarL/FixJ family response regulator
MEPIDALVPDESSPRIAVAGAEDVLMRRLVVTLTTQGMDVAQTASSIVDIARDAAEIRPSVLVWAVRESGRTVTTTVRALEERLADTPLVLVTNSAKARELRRLLDAGARGLVLESQLSTTLVPTIRAVCAGQLAIPGNLRGEATKPPLSHREKEILHLVAAGLTNGEIAAQMYLAESTVKSHLGSAFAKLGVNSRSEAAVIVLDPNERRALGLDLAVQPST